MYNKNCEYYESIIVVQNVSKSIEACAAHYGEDSKAMREYMLNGERLALELNNRGLGLSLNKMDLYLQIFWKRTTNMVFIFLQVFLRKRSSKKSHKTLSK